MQEIKQPYMLFNDLDGRPLENGFVYIGQENMDPLVEANRVAVYYDRGLTAVADQPLRTISGYIDRDGSPARLFVSGGRYSMKVRDSQSAQVFYDQSLGDEASASAGQPYLVHFWHEEEIGVSQTIYAHPFDRSVTFATDLPDAAFFYVGTAPASSTVFSLSKLDTGQFGTLTVDTLGDVAVESDEITFDAGDVLLIVAPGLATSMEDFAGTLTGATS